MLDLGLVDELLPEVYDMVAADERGLGKFNRIPLIFDELVEEGREVSDGALLAALLLPKVLLRRYDTEAAEGHPMSRGALATLVAEVAEPLATRFVLSRARAERIGGSLETFLRLCEPDWQPEGRRRFALRKDFDDALVLLEVVTRATGEGGEVLAGWSEAARDRPEPRSETPPGRGRPRRRRRRPRR
jgi:hypothetical protein